MKEGAKREGTSTTNKRTRKIMVVARGAAYRNMHDNLGNRGRTEYL